MIASYALFFFWLFVMLGRFALAGTARVNLKKMFISLVVMLAIACIAAGISSSTTSILIAFCLAGLGCSSLLPLIYQYCQKLFEGQEMAISGMLGGMYVIGYGLSAAGVACVERRAQISFTSVFIGVGTLLIMCIVTLSWNRKASKALS